MSENDNRKVITKITSQKEAVKIANYFAKRDVSMPETVLGAIASVVFYGVGVGVVIYLLVNLML